MIKKILLLFAFLFFIFITLSACGQDREDRTKNIEIGKDYNEFKKTKPLAEQGNSNAQLKLALMYDKGQGVLPNRKEAVKWFLLAAEQNEPEAQNSLGLKYYDGRGVTKDFAQAYKWFNIASANGHKRGKSMTEVLKKEMTAPQLASAKKLIREWLENYTK